MNYYESKKSKDKKNFCIKEFNDEILNSGYLDIGYRVPDNENRILVYESACLFLGKMTKIF